MIDLLRRYEEELISTLSPRKVFKSSSPVHSTPLGHTLGYVPLFNSPTVEISIQQLMRRIKIAQYVATKDRDRGEAEERRLASGLLNNLKFLFSASDTAMETKTLRDKRRIPEILAFILETSATMFHVDPQAICIDELVAQSIGEEANLSQNESTLSSSSAMMYNTISFNGTIPSPAQVRSRVPVYRGDPALFPIRNSEVSFLVRFLYQLCLKINFMVSEN